MISLLLEFRFFSLAAMIFQSPDAHFSIRHCLYDLGELVSLVLTAFFYFVLSNVLLSSYLTDLSEYGTGSSCQYNPSTLTEAMTTVVLYMDRPFNDLAAPSAK